MKQMLISIDHDNYNNLEDLRVQFNKNHGQKLTTRQFVGYMVNRWLKEGAEKKRPSNVVESNVSESGDSDSGESLGEQVQTSLRDKRRSEETRRRGIFDER